MSDQVVIVSKAKFEEMNSKYAAMKISEKKPVETVKLGTKEIVITGGASCKATGWYEASGMEVIEKRFYKGDIEPMTYGDHGTAVREGRIQRGYTYMQISSHGRILVFIGERLTFKTAPEGEQLNLF